MIAEAGVLCLVMALLLAVMESMYLLPVRALREVIAKIMPVSAWLQAMSITAALAILVTLRLDSDFTVANVVQHSNLSLPNLYKIVGSWGNHEGSMLLWVLVLALFGACLHGAKQELSLYAGSVQSVLCAGFLAFILCTSNPFARIFPPPPDGQTLNPLLQDVGLAMHPPLLYLGYVGFSIVFSLGVAGLITKKAGRQWAQIAHPWIMLSWSSLTLGIGLGSWWAYRELGWGGWWFWDPVENASLLPWLAGTALLHSNIVLKKRGMLAQWVILLAIITFALSLLGTFLVRSGAITSVHSFASDPARGIFILAYIFVTVGAALFLYSLRSATLNNDEDSRQRMLPVSREGFIVANNLFVLSACATVLLGTLYPLFAELAGAGKISVGAPYFEATFIPLMAMPMVFAAFTPFMAWKKASLKQALSMARPAIIATIAGIFIILAFIHTKAVSAACGFGLALWIAAGSLKWLKASKGRGKYSVFAGHIGAAFIIAGITASGIWKEEKQLFMSPGDSLVVAGYNVTYVGSKDVDGANYKAKQAQLEVTSGADNKPVAVLLPQYRTYEIKGSTTSETAIHYGILGDLYSAIGEQAADGRLAIRLYFEPLISFIWIGFVLMAAGGIVSYLGRGQYNKHYNDSGIE